MRKTLRNLPPLPQIKDRFAWQQYQQKPFFLMPNCCQLSGLNAWGKLDGIFVAYLKKWKRKKYTAVASTHTRYYLDSRYVKFNSKPNLSSRDLGSLAFDKTPIFFSKRRKKKKHTLTCVLWEQLEVTDTGRLVTILHAKSRFEAGCAIYGDVTQCDMDLQGLINHLLTCHHCVLIISTARMFFPRIWKWWSPGTRDSTKEKLWLVRNGTLRVIMVWAWTGVWTPR